MLDVVVIADAAAAEAVLDPIRARLLAEVPDPALEPNMLSARWMLALAARLVKDVGTLFTGADRAKQRLATFAMDGEVSVASAAERAAFVAELAAGTAKLVENYHSGTATGGRKHRIVVALHPSVTPDVSATTGPQKITHNAGTTGQTEEP
ncbi:hypothetical protein ART_3663 [Arthrobacter sp. PAMC 25486]|uniref:hypothetical protein n=1 Tax=Arthrobacter sp. PAMC 25486 TaxID=1494608 RepID=UPI0005362AB4|nr:hypothetical protein [Arthrobacter sp. PAMC 25486]AIY03262.1 hypothetical protein ART_3663 [Arthrobacter sp. PAMC 25486]